MPRPLNNYVSVHSISADIEFSLLCKHSDVRNNENKTPLHLACSHGSKEVVQYLVEEVKCDVGESSCSASGHNVYCTYC